MKLGIVEILTPQELANAEIGLHHTQMCLSAHHQNHADYLKLFRPSTLKLLEHCMGSVYCVEFTDQIQLLLFTNEEYVDSDLFIKNKISIVHKKR